MLCCKRALRHTSTVPVILCQSDWAIPASQAGSWIFCAPWKQFTGRASQHFNAIELFSLLVANNFEFLGFSCPPALWATLSACSQGVQLLVCLPKHPAPLVSLLSRIFCGSLVRKHGVKGKERGVPQCRAQQRAPCAVPRLFVCAVMAPSV